MEYIQELIQLLQGRMATGGVTKPFHIQKARKIFVLMESNKWASEDSEPINVFGRHAILSHFGLLPIVDCYCQVAPLHTSTALHCSCIVNFQKNVLISNMLYKCGVSICFPNSKFRFLLHFHFFSRHVCQLVETDIESW